MEPATFDTEGDANDWIRDERIEWLNGMDATANDPYQYWVEECSEAHETESQ